MKILLDPITGNISFQFHYNKDLVQAIKSLPERRYDPETKVWSFPANKHSISEFISILKAFNCDPALISQTETECNNYLAEHSSEEILDSSNTNQEFETKIKPTIMRLGELVLACYLEGKISNNEQVKMIDLINHISLKDFIK